MNIFCQNVKTVLVSSKTPGKTSANIDFLAQIPHEAAFKANT